MRETALIDAIESVYRAAFGRSHWPECLRQLADLIEAQICVLLARKPRTEEWQIVASAGLTARFVEAYNCQGTGVDPFVLERGSALVEEFTVQRVDPHTPVDGPFDTLLCESPGYRVGLFGGTTALGGTAILSWRRTARRYSDEDEHVLRRLWPHVIRARIIESTRLESSPSTCRSWAEAALDCWHVGVIGFSSLGLPVFTNQAARLLTAREDGLSIAREGPVASIASETRALRDGIRLLVHGAHPGPEWLKLSRPSGARAYEVVLCRIPVPEPEGPRVVMFVTAPDATIPLSVGALRKLHGLTELESRVANCLVHGMHVREMVPALGLSLQTARWYVQQVRQKMDTSSQNDVVRYLIRSVTGIDVGHGSRAASGKN